MHIKITDYFPLLVGIKLLDIYIYSNIDILLYLYYYIYIYLYIIYRDIYVDILHL